VAARADMSRREAFMTLIFRLLGNDCQMEVVKDVLKRTRGSIAVPIAEPI
jgi:hypothetical protein